MITATVRSISEITNKNPLLGKISKYNPPKSGPVKLPKLKKIPQSKFPVGSSSFGVKSVIYVIPSENIEPTHIPAKKKTAATNNSECSKKFPIKKKMLDRKSVV